MKETQRGNIQTIKISVTENKDYSGSASVHFKVLEVNSDNLFALLTSSNFSLIHWNNSDKNNGDYSCYRKGSNFESASGIILDFDNTLLMDEAKQRLEQQDLNYYLITSKSHKAEEHHFHVLILFDKDVKSPNYYQQIFKYVKTSFFQESDQAVEDLARFFYGSPSDALWYEKTNGVPLNTGSILGIVGWQLNPDHTIKLSNGTELPINQIASKTPCHCPHPDHDDARPSAFADLKAGKHFIHCSGCNWTWWEQDNTPNWEKVCEPYWSYGTDIYDFGIVGGEFFYEKIGEKKFYAQTQTRNDSNHKQAAYDYLVREKHIRHLKRIDYLGDVNTTESYFKVLKEQGIIEVHYSAIQVNIQDNAFVESYLKDRFGKYTGFIKEWLSMYCFTNHVKLPTLIFLGKRGNGKTTFAELVGEIFKPLAAEWKGSEENFTYEAEKKLLIVEENENSAPHQYKTLKKYTGQKYATVNKKFRDPYQVKNNMTIILLANDALPLFVSRDELPTSFYNNQFFIYGFPEIQGKLNVNIQTELTERMGHYIRTELKTVYQNIISDGCRYGIKVPITEEEKALFKDSVSNIEYDADWYIQKVITQYSEPNFEYQEYIEKGFLPTQFFHNSTFTKTHINSIIKNLKKRGYLEGGSERFQISGSREYCFKITPKLKSELQQHKNGCSGYKSGCKMEGENQLPLDEKWL